MILTCVHRLDLRKKELTQQKEDLLKQGKAKAVTLDSVKSQIDLLMKVGFMLVCLKNTVN